MNIEITLNGNSMRLSGPLTIGALLSQLTLKTEGCALAVNAVVIARSSWSEAQINDGDDIAIFQAIAGG
jgi:sulfur carrier protein